MNKQKIRVRKTVTDLDRAMSDNSAVSGGPIKKHSAQDFVFISRQPIPTAFRFNELVYDLLYITRFDPFPPGADSV